MQMHLQNVTQNSISQRARLHWEEHFDATIQVAGHQISTAQEDVVLFAMAKVIDAGVLQETANDGRYRDGVTHTGDTWSEAAHATHLEVNAHPRLRGTVERLDTWRVHQGVHFKGEITITMLAMSFDLAINPCQDMLAQAVWRNEQLVIRRFSRITGERVEQVGDVLTNRGVTCHIAEIRIYATGYVVIIAGTHMRIVLQVALLPPYHQAEFGMGLESLDAVGHMDPCVFKGPGPGDVTLFIKARLQLYEHGDLFAMLPRLQ